MALVMFPELRALSVAFISSSIFSRYYFLKASRFSFNERSIFSWYSLTSLETFSFIFRAISSLFFCNLSILFSDIPTIHYEGLKEARDALLLLHKNYCLNLSYRRILGITVLFVAQCYRRDKL